MTVIVTDTGFAPDGFNGEFTALEEAQPGAPALDLPSDTDPATLTDRLDGVEAIRVDFPSFADGRGFTIARQLRLMGFTGRLRARGHVIADQYPMARACGFDEVEVDDNLAERQPEQHWLSSQSEWGHALSASQLRAAE